MKTGWDSEWAGQSGGVEQLSDHAETLERWKWNYLKPHLPAQGRSLEVGCGSGRLSASLAASGLTPVLLDLSMEALMCARKSYSATGGADRKLYVRGDTFCLPLAAESIDVVVSGGLLEHFEDPACVIAEMARVLVPDGVFYADIWPNRFSAIRAIERLHRRHVWDEYALDVPLLQSQIADAGLELMTGFWGGVLPPRCIPGSGRFAWLQRWLRKSIVDRAEAWRRWDGTWVARTLGGCYYVVARKRGAGCT